MLDMHQQDRAYSLVGNGSSTPVLLLLICALLLLPTSPLLVWSLFCSSLMRNFPSQPPPPPSLGDNEKEAKLGWRVQLRRGDAEGGWLRGSCRLVFSQATTQRLSVNIPSTLRAFQASLAPPPPPPSPPFPKRMFEAFKGIFFPFILLWRGIMLSLLKD